MLVVSVVNLLLSHACSDQIPAITTLGLSENVATLQQSILLCSGTWWGTVSRDGGGGETSHRLMWSRQSPEANFCGFNMGDSWNQHRGLRMVDICRQGRNTRASSCSCWASRSPWLGWPSVPSQVTLPISDKDSRVSSLLQSGELIWVRWVQWWKLSWPELALLLE